MDVTPLPDSVVETEVGDCELDTTVVVLVDKTAPELELATTILVTGSHEGVINDGVIVKMPDAFTNIPGLVGVTV